MTEQTDGQADKQTDRRSASAVAVQVFNVAVAHSAL